MSAFVNNLKIVKTGDWEVLNEMELEKSKCNK